MGDTSFENGDVDEENTFNILIATDIHLGFMEKHPLRGNILNENINYCKSFY
jgi:hypothetical protein